MMTKTNTTWLYFEIPMMKMYIVQYTRKIITVNYKVNTVTTVH